jgi:hypothetical protein
MVKIKIKKIGEALGFLDKEAVAIGRLGDL